MFAILAFCLGIGCLLRSNWFPEDLNFVVEVCQLQIKQPITAALLCGAKSLSPSNQQILISSGGLHAFVVSGGHLIWLESQLKIALAKGQVPFWTLHSVLFLYSAICGFDAPVVRAFLQLSLFALGKHRYWLLSPGQTTLLSGLSCLCLNPGWATSLSLHLSWLASLFLVVKGKLWPRATWLGDIFVSMAIGLFLPAVSGGHPLVWILGGWIIPWSMRYFLPLAWISGGFLPLREIIESGFSECLLVLGTINAASGLNSVKMTQSIGWWQMLLTIAAIHIWVHRLENSSSRPTRPTL